VDTVAHKIAFYGLAAELAGCLIWTSYLKYWHRVGRHHKRR
jgi:hypothetical protein